MKILEEYHCLCQYYYKTWIFYLNDCVLNSGITFQSWKSSSKNLIDQEHCILVILFKSTFCIPPFS